MQAQMLEHLLTADPKKFTSHEDASPGEVLTAKFKTSFLADLDLPSDEKVLSEAQRSVARNVFATMTTGQTEEQQKLALTKLEVPDAVKQVVGMLSAYDWQFVEQAKEMRGYTVAKIIEETVHPEARYRLKALELLGKVTEVALFTERHEVKQVGMSDSELDAELKKRLNRYTELQKIEEKVVEALPEGEKT
jgi:hypothetical protein